MWWLMVMMFGFVLEGVGLGLASWGLWGTWRDNADGRPFWPAKIRRFGAWVRTHILRRPPKPIVGHMSVALGGAGTLDVAGTVSQGLNDSMTVDQKIEAVQANALAAQKAASEASHAIRNETREREREVAALQERITAAEQQAATYARGLVVTGVPKAVLGLAAAAIGLALQGVASVATFDVGDADTRHVSTRR